MAPFVQSTLRHGPLGLVEVLSQPLVPGEQRALPEGQNLLLLVDQIRQEVLHFRRQGDEQDRSEADSFVALLLESAHQQRVPIYVIVTMRSDYLGDCAVFRGLPEAINKSQFLTPRLTRDQRHAAIEGPARVFGGKVEGPLVNLLLNDTESDVDQLPLTQHALMRMWAIASSRSASAGGADSPTVVLTPEDYLKIGPFDRALASDAEHVYQHEIAPASQPLVQTLFRCLIEPSEGKLDTARPCRLAEIAEVARTTPEQIAGIVEKFREPDRNFLLPARPAPLLPDSLIRISHECLIRHWRQLHDWAGMELKDVEDGRHIARKAQYWQVGKEEPWRKAQLDDAQSWLLCVSNIPHWPERYKHRINFDLIRDFLRAGEDAKRKAVFRILTLDSGGLTTAFSASILATLEERTGKRIVDHFDLIVGTEMGAVVAVALGLKIPAREIVAFFLEWGPKICGSKQSIAEPFRLFRQLFRPKFSAEILREAFTSLLEGKSFLDAKTLDRSRCRLLIPAYNILAGTVHEFKTSHSARLRSDGGISAIEIAMAATATPTFFPAHTISGVGTFIDGRVWAACPALAALFEAIDVLKKDPADIRLLSLSSTSYRPQSRRNDWAGTLAWLPRVIEMPMLGQTQAAVDGAKQLLREGLFHRIDFVVPSGIIASDDPARLEELVALGRDTALEDQHLEIVRRSFLTETTSDQFHPLVETQL